MPGRPNLGARRAAFGRCLAVVVVGLAVGVLGTPAAADVLSSADSRTTKAAFAAADAGNWRKARRLAAKVKHRLPRKILRWMDYTRNGTNASFRDIGRFVVRHPDWPLQERLQRNAEAAISDRVAPSTLNIWFSRYPPISAAGMARYGGLLRATGAKEGGRAVLRDAWVRGNFTRHEERRFYRRYRKLLTRDDHIARIERLLWGGRYWPARRMLWKVGPSHRALAESRLMLMRRQGNVDAAIAKVPPALLQHPGLVYERLRWRRRKGLNTAFDLLAAAPDDMVRPEKWWTERAILARRALGKGHVSEAYRIVKDHGLAPGLGAAYAEAEWLAGWIALRFLSDNQVAMSHFRSMYAAVKFPVSRARGAYWAARAAEAMGRSKKARYWYALAARHPTTYYGQLAAARNDSGSKLWLPPDPQPSLSQIEAFDRFELVRVVRVLAQIGRTKDLRPFVLSLGAHDRSPEWQILSASLARFHGRPDMAIRLAKQTGRSGRALIGAAYPLRDVPILLGASPRRPELPLVLAVIRQESAFHPEAKSRAGARGLMQLMPGTARKVAKGLRMRYSRRRLTAEPEFNVKLGQAYLGDLIKEFDGSYVLALAAYNAGPGRARTWLRANGDPRESVSDAIDWVEMVPIGETRNYIQRVLEGLQVYRGRLLGAPVDMTLERDLRR